jgi:hypothetical protein
MFFALSCNLQKHIPDDELLLRSVNIENLPSGHRSDVKQLVRQKPNKRFLGIFRISMWIHIRADRGKERRFKNWIKENMGEAPVFLDTNAMNQSAVNIRNYLFSHGYFNADVGIETEGRK